ncbi:MAG: hypothetical protein U5R30_03365 [Deltaproteobacteria bacterium]|nr:hypothetical protein [Deltaproteobacteria bacterium]
MRWFPLLAYVLAACLWGQIGNADIYVWTDQDNVRHVTNQTPPPHAKILMQTEEIPYDETADRARREKEKRDELLRVQAELRENEARLAAQQAEAQRRVEEAERRAEEALQRLEDLLDSRPDGYDDNYVGSWTYGFPLYGYRWHGGRYHGKPSLDGKRHYGSNRYPFGRDRHLHKQTGGTKFHHNKTHNQINSGRRPSHEQRLKGIGFSPLRHQSGGRTHFNQGSRR